MLREFNLQEKGWDSLRKELNKREADTGKDVIDTVSNILKDVEENGDKALYAYTEKFDKLKLDSLVVSKEEIDECFNKVDNEFIKNLEEAKELRKEFVFKPVYSEIEKGVRTDYILNLNVGTRQVLVDSNLEFHIRQNPVFKASSIA